MLTLAVFAINLHQNKTSDTNKDCTYPMQHPSKKSSSQPLADPCQKIAVFQQQGSAESKIHGIRKYGGNDFEIEVVSIDAILPPVMDETEGYLPQHIQADLVLDFLKHPDLSHDLAALCRSQDVPVVASGKKLRSEGVITPPT